MEIGKLIVDIVETIEESNSHFVFYGIQSNEVVLVNYEDKGSKITITINNYESDVIPSKEDIKLIKDIQELLKWKNK